MIQIILSTAHGSDVAGKRVGDFYEYKYSRRLCSAIAKRLNSECIETHIDIIEPEEKSLYHRVAVINGYVDNNPDTICVSLHVNAGAETATGTQVHCCNGCSEQSEEVARDIYKYVIQNGLQGNRSVPEDYIWRNNFYILKHTKCPCTLVEVAFMTNPDDLAMMQSEEGFNRIADTIVSGIIDFVSAHRS